MITWTDFIFDDVVGPVLKDVRATDSDGTSIKDDTHTGSIQETRQGPRPARMVGLSSLENDPLGKEAIRGRSNRVLRQRGEG